MADHVGRRHHFAFLEVVGDIEQAGNEDPVAGDRLGLDLVAATAKRQAARDEAALGADRHDHRVLHLLGLDQAEHLGAEVFLAVRPAQAAASHLAAAQVHALDARRVDEDLVLGHRPGQLRDGLRVELEAEVALVLAVAVGLVEVGPQGRLDQVEVAPQDAVLVEHLDFVEGTEDRLLQLLLLIFQVFRGELARQVEAGLEQPHQLAGDVGVGIQRTGDVAKVEAQADLLQVTRVGTQQGDVAPRQVGGQHQAVEGVVLGVAADDVDEGVLEDLVELLDVHVQPFGVGEGEVVDPVFTAVLVAQAVGEFAEHAQAEVLQDRQDVGQGQRGVGVVQLAVQLLLALRQRLVEAHHQRALLGEAEQVLQVDHREVRGEALAIAGREAFREVGQDVGALGLAEVFHHQAAVVVLPGTAGLDHFFFQARRVDVDARLRVDAEDELHAGQYRLGEEGPELAVAGLQALHQDLLDLQARLGGIHVARHVGQAVAEATVGVLAQEHADLVALLDADDRQGGAEQLVHRGLEQVVARQYFQHLGQFLAEVGLGVETGAPHHFGDLAADEGDVVDALVVHRGGEQAHEAALADHPALAVQLADRHVIRVGRAVHTARMGSLGEGQQDRFAQVGDGIVLDVQVILAQAGTQQTGQAEEGFLVVDHAPAVGLVGDAEFLVAEEGEVVVQQPFEIAAHFLQFLRRHLQLGLAKPGQQFAGLGLHRFEVGDGHAYFTEHFQDGLLQRPQFAGVGATVDLQVHQRFLADVLALATLGQDFLQLALGRAAHAEDVGLQGMDAVAAAVQFHAHRVDQERQVRVQHFHRGVGGLPAVLLVVGVVYADFGLVAVEALQQAPGGKGATDQVGKPTLGQFIEGDQAEELFGEQRDLW